MQVSNYQIIQLLISFNLIKQSFLKTIINQIMVENFQVKIEYLSQNDFQTSIIVIYSSVISKDMVI
jgi:hypothetical protein